jgi:mRNA interferase MazF
MFEQGDIIKINLNPTKGHEQRGERPALIVSNNEFNQRAGGMAFVCPITNTNKSFPLHVQLDNKKKTTGVIMCDQIKAVDLKARGYVKIENLNKEMLEEVIDILNGCLEII